MKVLVNGDRGYIGAVLVPVLREAGHEVVGLDAGWYDGCDFGDRPARLRVAHRRHPGPEAGGPRGLRRGGPPGGDLQRPGRPPQPGGDVLRQRPRCGPHGRGGQGRRRAAVPVLLLVLAVRRRRRRAGDRGQRLQPGDALRREQGDGRAAHLPAGRRRLQPDLPAQRHGVRLVAAAARRHRGQQPDRHRLHPRRGPAAERRHRRGGRWCTCADIARAFLAVLEADASVVHDQAFNIGRDEDVVQIRDIATRGGGARSTRRSRSPRARPPTSGTTASTSARSTALLPAFRPQWTVPDGHRRAGRATWSGRARRRGLRGAAVRAARADQPAPGQGMLDDLLFVEALIA